jgi:hypothetical protein
MSAIGPKRTSLVALHMSAFGGKADTLMTGRKKLMFFHPCFAARLGGVSGGKDTQGWRASSHTAMVGAGNLGRRNCRWQRRRIQENLRPPSTL